MKHASASDLKIIENLLSRLDGLVEINKPLKRRKLGIYYLKSRAFLHFHEDDGSIFADVRLEGDDFDRLNVTAKSGQHDLVKRVEGVLAP